MSPSGAEVLRQIKSRIDEVDPAAVHEQVGNGAVIIDVREPEEWAAGHIPGAIHVPKSYFESRIEGAVPDRTDHVVLYCASGNRSAYAARTLQEAIGFEERYKFLLQDRDCIFAKHLDESVERLGIRVLKSPPRSPMANAICEDPPLQYRAPAHGAGSGRSRSAAHLEV